MSKDIYSPAVFDMNEYVTAASLIYLHGEKYKNYKNRTYLQT